MSPKLFAPALTASVVALILWGCARPEPRIDASNDETLKESIEQVRSTLTAEERQKFEESIQMLAFSDLFFLAADEDEIMRRMRDRLDGKSAGEVISAGEAVLRERREQERKLQEMEQERRKTEQEQIAREIEELEAKQQAAIDAQDTLEQLVVEASRFYYREVLYKSELFVDLTVRSNLDQAVASAYFHGVLASPGREVPWAEGDFSHSIPGGLEPGESANWQIWLRGGWWWRAPRDRNDMVMTVTVTRLDGADGEPLADANFPEYDAIRLEELKQALEQ